MVSCHSSLPVDVTDWNPSAAGAAGEIVSIADRTWPPSSPHSSKVAYYCSRRSRSCCTPSRIERLLPWVGYSLGINASNSPAACARVLRGMFMRDTEQQLVTSFIIVSGEQSVPDFGADLSLVLRPAHYN
jgi:hypothetical protein